MMMRSSSSFAFCLAPPSAQWGFGLYPKQGTPVVVHAEQTSCSSSHFFRRSLQVQHAPLLLTSLDMISEQEKLRDHQFCSVNLRKVKCTVFAKLCSKGGTASLQVETPQCPRILQINRHVIRGQHFADHLHNRETNSSVSLTVVDTILWFGDKGSHASHGLCRTQPNSCACPLTPSLRTNWKAMTQPYLTYRSIISSLSLTQGSIRKDPERDILWKPGISAL
jgi:hypothetical protein